MCYTGKCKYEVTSGPHPGECTVRWLADYPDDAECTLAAVEAAREKALKELEAPQIRR